MAVPGSGSPLLFSADAGAPGGITIERSLRFSSADSAYLNRTPASAGNRTTWTWAGWVKRTQQGEFHELFGAASSTSNYFALRFKNTDQLEAFDTAGAGLVGKLTTTAVYRDPSAWYHIVYVWDTDNSTAADTRRLYVNGIRVTAFDTNDTPPSGSQSRVNSGLMPHTIGRFNPTSVLYLNGYLADVHFIDGQALSPTDFGEFDATTGAWNPIAYTGTYGTNGFHLDFSDNSSAAALGYDAAGSNDWTVNNISVAAGAGNDSLVDSPTNGTQTDTGAGGEVPGNYATLNPLQTGSNTSLANGNLDFSNTATEWNTCLSTIFVSSGKWYCETVVSNAAATTLGWGIAKNSHGIDTYLGATADGWALYGNTTSSYTYTNGSTVNGSYCTLANNDVLGMALDMDAGTLTYYVNNVSQGTAFSGITGSVCFAVTAYPSGATSVFNFGQRAFAYTAPSGFKALCTANLDDPTIADPSTVMDVVTYTGNGSTQTISGLGFSPDFVWIKNRNTAAWHQLFDAVRGAGKALFSNATNAEITNDTYGYLDGFTSTGFSLDDASGGNVNASSTPYVAWTWDAGTSNATNTSGTITSTVRTNISAGFSIATYTGNGTAGASFGHGLGVTPELVIIKDRDAVQHWRVYHKSTGASYIIYLSSTSEALGPSANSWNSTAPTSSVITLGSDVGLNNNGNDYVAYCWTPVEGYSAFGSYTGNGSSSSPPFIFTSFRPRWVLIKSSSNAVDWIVLDTARSTYNGMRDTLYPNLSDAEYSSYEMLDVYSNGFAPRAAFTNINASGYTYIYAAFAESPLRYARAR